MFHKFDSFQFPKIEINQKVKREGNKKEKYMKLKKKEKNQSNISLRYLSTYSSDPFLSSFSHPHFLHNQLI